MATVTWVIVGVCALAFVFFAFVVIPLMYRRVVPTNEVHIVQSSKKTLSYGKDTPNGNTYYQWPSWIPFFGVNKSSLPVSVFGLDLEDYEAYDKGRLPFIVDVKAFFRITDSNVAAERVSSFSDLLKQLEAVVQGAVRSILACNELEDIMQGRSKFGDEFTKEVSDQLQNWGVQTVKNIELMDIRDAQGSRVIHNIMEKKKSHIEMESRQAVAQNNKVASISEIEARREIEVQQQEAAQQTGLRTVEARRMVELANQEATQSVKEQEKITKQKEMSVVEVESVAKAEIQKKVTVVKAAQDRETEILVAEGKLQAKKLESEGLLAEGNAKAAADKAMQLAPVEAQIVLAKEIGGNESYQKYLITIEQIKASQNVGIEQAKALEKADIKVIANTGDVVNGVNSVMDMFSAKGGTQLGAMLEAVGQTETGKKILHKITAKE